MSRRAAGAELPLTSSSLEETSPLEGRSRWPLLLAWLVTALTALALYAQTVTFQFVWDDKIFVQRNPAIRSWSYAPRYFTDGSTYAADFFSGMYRPMRNLSYLVDYQIAGMQPWFFHAHNVVLHAACACVALWTLLRLCSLLFPALRPGAALLPLSRRDASLECPSCSNGSRCLDQRTG